MLTLRRSEVHRTMQRTIRWSNFMSGDGETGTKRNSKPLRGAVAAALLGVSCHGGARNVLDAAFVYEQFSAIETAALACQPPSMEDKAGFGKKLAAARKEFVRTLQAGGSSSAQAEAEADRRSAAQGTRIAALIDAQGCDSGDVVPLLRRYVEIGAWDPRKGPFPLPPPPPVLSQATRDAMLAAAGYTREGQAWRNECGRAIEPQFTTVQLTGKAVPQVIVTSADAICYGHSEYRNTVLQQAAGRWTQLAELIGVLDVGSAVTHGYRELILGGPGYCGNEVYRWTGRAYAYVCNAPGDMDADLRRTCTAAPSRIRWCRPGRDARP
ncbi:hypothetical protein [Massilia rhizosphaerae]|uniref:hypothetical protein n=1 Tax=Massilia rhizosphaerae TaxID=2784389 RepID=UPI0018DDB59C|nr:hypothetical protein [Massilia rhizosphaerae]